MKKNQVKVGNYVAPKLKLSVSRQLATCWTPLIPASTIPQPPVGLWKRKKTKKQKKG